ncbi:MAG: hypothetical protein WAP37_06565 [Solirubrobacterales bacterium]
MNRFKPALLVAIVASIAALAAPGSAAAGGATTINSGPGAGATIASTVASFTFSSAAPPPFTTKSFQCRIDAGSYAGCTSPKTYFGLTQGAHTFRVRAVWCSIFLPCTSFFWDAGAETTRTFSVDTDPPTTIVTGGPSGPSGDNTPTWAFTSDEPIGDTFACGLDPDGPGIWFYAPCSSPKTYGPLADGGYTFHVKASDDVGNTDASPLTRHITIDATAPTVTFTGGPAEGSSIGVTSATFEFTTSELASTTCSVDGGAYGGCSSPYTINGMANGPHSLSVQASDLLGNTGPAATRNFIVATTAAAPPAQPTVPASGTVKATGCAAKKSRSARRSCLRRKALKKCRKLGKSSRKRCVRKVNKRYRKR